MGLVRQSLDFEDMLVSEEDAKNDIEMGNLSVRDIGSDDEFLSFYKKVVTGKLTFQCPNGLEQLREDVIERYGEKRVREYLES